MAIKSSPSSVTHAHRIINGSASGDYGAAQKFLKGMSSVERKARQRSESQSKVRPRKKKRPMGSGPYLYNSRQYSDG
jgi:hypothetical protein